MLYLVQYTNTTPRWSQSAPLSGLLAVSCPNCWKYFARNVTPPCRTHHVSLTCTSAARWLAGRHARALKVLLSCLVNSVSDYSCSDWLTLYIQHLVGQLKVILFLFLLDSQLTTPAFFRLSVTILFTGTFHMNTQEMSRIIKCSYLQSYVLLGRNFKNVRKGREVNF